MESSRWLDENSLFTRKPWLTDQSQVQDRPWGMLRSIESSLLYHFARDQYAGYGDIVDAGSFIGASAFSLASGLRDNERVKSKAQRIYAFDLFEVWHEVNQTDEEMAASLKEHWKIEAGPGESFFHVFISNLGGLSRFVKPVTGDILDQKWSGRPIELLFVDIAKSRPIMQHVVKNFYPSLIPGISVVVHQDYHHPLLPFIHVMQERLAQWFEIIEMKADDSIAMLLVDRVPDRVLHEVYTYEFSKSRQIDLMDSAIERLPVSERRHVRLAKIMLLRSLDEIAGANMLLAELQAERDQHSEDPHFLPYLHWTEKMLREAPE